MMLNDFVQRVKTGNDVDFQDTMAIIAEHYHYQPVDFTNGIDKPIHNPAGTNEGSCKIFAFALLHDFNQTQTLTLFGAYYRQDVLNNPGGNDHQNIRTFMRDGWAGIRFEGQALAAKDLRAG
ncbi:MULTISPECIES: HopJ type III effector protein [Methylomonas]|uniref:HopJ type III effector protein n=1 Tax=Methylomonas TaxID=416 RepID=UPI0012328131|nr:HopJ type III effector protein [Methylomonas rhizoryzae]